MRQTIGTRRHGVAGLAAVGIALALAAGPAAAQGSFTVEITLVDDLKAVFATVESIDTTVARSRLAGTVRDLRIEEGSQVREGEPIARVHDEKLALEAAAVDSRIRASESEVKLAEIGLRRMTTLHERNTVSQAALDDARTGLDVAMGNLAVLRAERAVIAQRKVEGDVLAPTSGRVLRKSVTDGQVVLPGEVVATIAVRAYILRLYLPERHARFLRVGDSVRVGARGLAAEDSGLRDGRVFKVYPELDRGRVVADVEVAGLGDYFVGERARVYVVTGARQAIVVPRGYIFTRYGVTYAHLAGAGETVVQTGQAIGSAIEILSGLRPGDRLIPPVPDAAARAAQAGR